MSNLEVKVRFTREGNALKKTEGELKDFKASQDQAASFADALSKKQTSLRGEAGETARGGCDARPRPHPRPRMSGASIASQRVATQNVRLAYGASRPPPTGRQGQRDRQSTRSPGDARFSLFSALRENIKDPDEIRLIVWRTRTQERSSSNASISRASRLPRRTAR